MSQLWVGFIIGAPVWGFIGMLIMSLLVVAKQSDKHLECPQGIDDLLDSPSDHFDKRV